MVWNMGKLGADNWLLSDLHSNWGAYWYAIFAASVFPKGWAGLAPAGSLSHVPTLMSLGLDRHCELI